MNGAATSTAPVLAPANKSSKPQKRIVDKLIESDDDGNEKLPTENENSDFMLNQYINPNGPSPKRFKDDENDQNQPSTSNQITPNRNPFKKSDSCVDPLLSPTRISKENNSLVKTQSPVKRYNYSRLEKLGKIGKRGLTVVSNEQRVISRFFTANQNDAAAIAKADSGIQEDSGATNDDNANVKAETNAQMKSPILLGTSLAAPATALYFTNSIDSPIKPMNSTGNVATAMNVDDGEVYDQKCHRIVLDQFKCVLKGKMEDAEQDANGLADSQGASDKTDESELHELPIVLSDDDADSGLSCSGNVASKEPSNRNWLPSSQTQKSVSQNRSIYSVKV